MMIMLSWLTKGRAYLGERFAKRSPRTPPVSIPTALPTLKKMSMVAVSVAENPVICRERCQHVAAAKPSHVTVAAQQSYRLV